MKYERLTKRIAKDEEAFLFHSSLHEAIERLAELEDKIESGELVDVSEDKWFAENMERAFRQLKIASGEFIKAVRKAQMLLAGLNEEDEE